MTSNDIYTITQHPNANSRQIERYVKFIESCRNKTHDGYTENHHILPQSIYPEFKNLKLHEWNSIRLSSRQHFIAHCILSRAFKYNSPQWHSMIKAFNRMGHNGGATKSRYINSRLYEQNRKHMSVTMRETQTGKLNSQYGTMWAFNPYTNKHQKIQKELINECYEQGWFITRSETPYKQAKTKETQEIKKEPSINKISYIRIAHPLIGKIKILHNNLYDYMLDGFIVCERSMYGQNTIKLTKNKINVQLPKQCVDYFIEHGWVPGMYTPNHKGTTGKKYSIINGKKIFL